MLWVVVIAVLKDFSRLSFKMLGKLTELEHMRASVITDILLKFIMDSISW